MTDHQASELPEPIEIVLAVVRHGERLCLVRRSALVRGGVGLWSAVTGYVDPGRDPLSQVWTELAEELELRPPTARLVLAQPAVALTSPASGKVFRVHPFLFEADSAEVVLNWEHDAVEWVEPVQLAQLECVGWQLALIDALLAGPGEGGPGAGPP